MTGEIDRELTEMLHGLMPFAATLGLAARSAGPERVVATCEWTEDRCTTAGLLHGGYLMAAADTVGATCAALNLPVGATTSTIESKTNFFRPVTGGPVEIVATPVNVGSTVIVVQTDTLGETGKLVARTTQSQAVRTA